MYGSDQSASLEKRGLEILVSGVRSVEKSLGSGKKEFGDAEQKVAAKKKLTESAEVTGNRDVKQPQVGFDNILDIRKLAGLK